MHQVPFHLCHSSPSSSRLQPTRPSSMLVSLEPIIPPILWYIHRIYSSSLMILASKSVISHLSFSPFGSRSPVYPSPCSPVFSNPPDASWSCLPRRAFRSSWCSVLIPGGASEFALPSPLNLSAVGSFSLRILTSSVPHQNWVLLDTLCIRPCQYEWNGAPEALHTARKKNKPAQPTAELYKHTGPN